MHSDSPLESSNVQHSVIHPSIMSSIHQSSVFVNMQEMVSNLARTVQGLQERVSAQDELLRRLNLLEEENSSLKSEVTRLSALLAAKPPATGITTSPEELFSNSDPKNTPQTHPKITGFESRDLPTSNSARARHQPPVPDWATIARRIPASRPPPSVRKFVSAARAFAPPNPAADTGFEYVYLARKRKFTRGEIRANLRRLGVDTSRLIDISFPARSCVGLLVHTQYLAELLSQLAAAKVSPVIHFDPVDPTHLADPKFAGDSLAVRSAKILEIHSDRCVGVLRHVRPHLVPAIGAAFFSAGWISEETLESSIASALPFSGKKRSRVHLRDEDMSDAGSVSSHNDSAEDKHNQ